MKNTQSWTFVVLMIGVGACAGDLKSNTRNDANDGNTIDAGVIREIDAKAEENVPDAEVVANPASKAQFEKYTQVSLHKKSPKGSCASCHQGADKNNVLFFMGASKAENYSALIENTKLVGIEPGVSELILKGNHEGDGFCDRAGSPYSACEGDEYAKVRDWIRFHNE